jgi:hypothetical protein
VKPKISNKTLGFIGVALATLTTVYGFKNRKEIREKTEDVKEKEQPTILIWQYDPLIF